MQETTDTPTADAAVAPRTDRLEVLKELGRGSIGVVRKARNPQLDRLLALRQFEVPEWLDNVDDLIARILTEARAASVLDHPAIARLHTCGYKGCTIFMTSEFVEGQTLKEILGTRTPELAEVLSWAKQLCSALDHAHGKGVFHHLLNPSNIKVLPGGTLKILDFGLWGDKHLLSQTPAKKLANEPYFSPEQIKGKPVDRAANLFSAAAILYELYTARSPFSGKHLGEVDRAILDLTPNPLNMAHPRVSPAISRVILQALSKAPRERFSSGQQLADALQAAATTMEPARLNGQPAALRGGHPEMETGARAPHKPPGSNSDSPPTTKFRAESQPPTTIHVPVGSGKSHWKLAAAAVACLVVVAAVAAFFQRKPGASNPSASQTSHKAQAAPAASAPGVTGAAPEDIQPLTTFRTPSVLTASRRRRARRAAKGPAPAVPTTPQQGELSISSAPSGATVAIEGMTGQSWNTPQSIAGLAPGSYRITVSKPGYAPQVQTVQVSAGNRVDIAVQLNPVKGWLTVAGSPAGARISIDGKDTNKVTPATFMLDPAAHKVSLHKAGYLDASREIQLAAGQSTSYSPSLMVAGRTDNIRIVGGGLGRIFGGGSLQGRARIEIKSEPKGAQVIINGTALGKTTPLEIQVEAGNYDIVLQKDGYKPVRENAIVGMEDRIKIDRTLSR